MKLRHALVAFVIGALAGCADAPGAARTREEGGAPVVAGSFDQRFLDTMSKHHAQAIEMARLAAGKVQHDELKQLVGKMPVDQQREIDQMQAWRAQWFGDEPDAAAEMAGMDMSHLRSMPPGHEYDLMFIDMMIPHHETAVRLSREALSQAERQEVRTLAQQIIDMQEREIAQMRAWRTAWSAGDAPRQPR